MASCLETEETEKHTGLCSNLSHIRGDKGGGSIGTWPRVRVHILIKPLFHVQNETKRDQMKGQGKLLSEQKVKEI